MSRNNQRCILIEWFTHRIRLALQHDVGKYMTTTDALNHLQKSDPVIRDLFVLMKGGGDLGTATRHTLYDILQEAVVRAIPGVKLAFRNTAILEAHKTLSDIGEPCPSIGAFQTKYGVKTSGARLFLHLAPANPLPSESSIHVEELAVNVVSSLDIESTNSVKLTKAISAATHLISSFSAQFPTLVTLLPGAKESLAGLEEAHQDKRQRLAEPAGSSSSIVHAQGTPVELAGSSSSIVPAQVMPVAVVVAPKGGSLNQEQVDALVERGVTTNGINDLAQLPLAMSSPLCDQLLAAGPEVQKGLINKMRTAMVSYAWKVSVGTCEALVNARLAELAKEAIASDRAEKQAKQQEIMESQISIANDKRIAHPWLSFFQRPIHASEWTAPVLHSFCEQREGLRLLLDGATGLNVKFNELTVICQLSTFVEILAYYSMYDSSRYRWVQADGFVGRCLHPSGVLS
jgi:hypothetical protein